MNLRRLPEILPINRLFRNTDLCADLARVELRDGGEDETSRFVVRYAQLFQVVVGQRQESLHIHLIKKAIKLTI